MANFLTLYPLPSILLISLVLTLVTTLIYKYTTNQAKLKAHREELKSIRKQMMESKNDPKKLEELQSRSLQISMEQMTQSFKPMIFTMLPAILVFAFINSSLTSSTVILPFPFDIPKMGDNSGFGWLGIYILSSIIFSSLLRKALKVY